MEKTEGNLEGLHKSTWPHSPSSLANIRVIFWQKTTKIWSRGTCIQNFRSLLFYITSGQGVRYKFKHEQGNQGDMGKIHVTQQFFAASGPQDQFFWKKPRTRFYICFREMCRFSFGQEVAYRQTHQPTYIRATHPPSHVDFWYLNL